MVQRALDALASGDAAQIVELIHPYVHFTRPDGRVIRGRSRMLAELDATLPAAPASIELRDGQIYRWTEPASG
jgi:hypothetical protein